MWRVVVYLVAILLAAMGLAWLADRPGSLIVSWQGYELVVTVFEAVVALSLAIGLSIVLWSIARQLWLSPAVVGSLINRRRHKRGLDAISSGMIAIGAGDRSLASRYAMQARKTLPNEPLTHLLRAQAAQLSGDKPTARRIFEAMLASPDTEQLGLRGLFLEAEREGEMEAARQFAERALAINPKLSWPVDAVFDIQCKAGDWAAALETLATARKHGQVEKAIADRRRAVLLTAQAQPLEDNDSEKALNLALEAHGLAPDLVPAAAIAGRVLASKGNTPRAAKVIQQTWKHTPHPDLATVYAYARIGDSPRDRLQRVKQLALLYPNSAEGPIAVANAAIEAREFDEARAALDGLVEGRLTQRVCLLMARIEGEQHGDKGRVREWLARTVNAPRDPAWTADGVVSDQWQPRSPVTGALDAFQWRVPLEQAEKREAGVIAQKLEELVALGAPREMGKAATIETIEADAPAAAREAGKPAPSSRADVARAEDAVIIAETPKVSAPEKAAEPGTSSKSSASEPLSAPRFAPKSAASAAAMRSAASPDMDAASVTSTPSAVEARNGVAAAAATVVPAASFTAAPPGGTGRPASKPASPPAPVKEAAMPQSAPAKAPAAPVAKEPPKPAQAAPAAVAAKTTTPSVAKPAALPEARPQSKGAATNVVTPKVAAATSRQAPAPVKTGPAVSKTGPVKPKSEPQIFVSPRAPDDPGPEPVESDELRSPLVPYRTTS